MSSAAVDLDTSVAQTTEIVVAPNVRGFRACELCIHAITTADGRFLCASPATHLSGGAEPIPSARAIDGSCGPNARHLDMHAWAA